MPEISSNETVTETIVEEIPKQLPVLPLRDNVIFPYMIFPVLVGRDQSIRAANFALDNSKYIFLAAQKKSNIEDPSIEDIYKEGTIAKIIQILKLPNGLMKILLLVPLLVFASTNLKGQACCSAGSPLLGSLEVSNVYRGELQVGLSTENFMFFIII